MDNRRLDTLARSLVQPAGRRFTLRLFIAGLGAVIGLPEAAAAKCVKLNRRCKTRRGTRRRCCGGAKCRGIRCRCTGAKIPCQGRCIRAECCRNRDCPGNQTCQDGTCGEPAQGGCVMPTLASVEVGQVVVGPSGGEEGMVSLDCDAVGDTNVVLSVDNERASVAPGFVTVPDGQRSAKFGVEGISPGPVVLTATLDPNTMDVEFDVE